jgi:hypothetical protein
MVGFPLTVYRAGPGARFLSVGASDKKLVNLTNMWEAEGSPYNKRPNDFTSSVQAKELIDFLEKVRSGKFPFLKIIRGRGKPQGTYAHRAKPVHVGIATSGRFPPSPAIQAMRTESVTAGT